jgi:uncharacterized membrane protein
VAYLILLLDSAAVTAHNAGYDRVKHRFAALLDSVIGPVMVRWFLNSTGQLLIWTVVLGLLVAVVAYLSNKARAKPVQQEPEAGELMAKFREMHSRGELSDAEYRTIKTTLATRFQEELRGNGETG